MQNDLLEKETGTEFERIAANFMVDPANAECIAEDAAWDVTVGDGLEVGIRILPFIVTGSYTTDQKKEDGYDEWLRVRLTNAIQKLDSGKIKSYSNSELKENLTTRRAEWRTKQPTITNNK